MCLGNWDSGRDKTFGLYTVIARTQISENSSSRKIERFDQEFSCRLDRVILPSNLPNRIFDQKLNWLKLLIGKLTTKHDVPQCRMVNRHGENPGFFHIGFFQTFFGKSIRIWLDTLATHQVLRVATSFVGKMAVPTGSSPAWLASSCSIDRQNIWPEIFKRLGPALMPLPQFTLTFGSMGKVGGAGQSCGIAPWNDLRGSTHRLRVKWRFKLANDNLNWTVHATWILPPSTVCRMSYVSWLSPTVLAHFRGLALVFVCLAGLGIKMLSGRVGDECSTGKRYLQPKNYLLHIRKAAKPSKNVGLHTGQQAKAKATSLTNSESFG